MNGGLVDFEPGGLSAEIRLVHFIDGHVLAME